MAHHSGQIIQGNDTATWGKDQNWAVVWFISVIILAFFFVRFLAGIDSWMYHHKGEVNVAGVKLYDNDKYRSNRVASFGIAAERSDKRTRTSLNEAYSNIEAN